MNLNFSCSIGGLKQAFCLSTKAGYPKKQVDALAVKLDSGVFCITQFGSH